VGQAVTLFLRSHSWWLFSTGLTEELVDCSGGEEVSLEAGTKRKLEALGKVSEGRVQASVITVAVSMCIALWRCSLTCLPALP
jgi:hypothetical protein